MDFRKDINGLRAWAVVLVILFHFGVPGFKGGGVGVDVFFVISGFLMTKIIYKGIYSNNWEYKAVVDFYLARAKRIIPALLILCLVLMICGYFFLTLSEYKELSKHVIASLGFFSNIQFLRESGYFDIASHKKFLLHTWSLSVEWQFYLILPVVLLGLNKIFKKEKIVSLFVVFGFVVSYILSVALTYKMPSASFYLIPTRTWEMLAGGLVFIFFERDNFSFKQKKLLEISGFFIILGSAVFIEQKDIWPGYLALVPVFGTAMLLAANGQGFLTNHEVAQWLGKASYSLYLWHWPLAVVLFYVGWFGQAIPTTFALLLTLLLGWISWKFIEIPSRDILSKINSKGVFLIISTTVILFLSISLLIFLNNGLAFRNHKAFEAYSESFNKNPLEAECFVSGLKKIPGCIYGDREKISLIVIGDSHAASVIRSVEKALGGNGVLDWTLTSCLTASGISNGKADYRCGAQVLEFLDKLKYEYKDVPLLIVNRSSAYIEGQTGPEKNSKSNDIFFINEKKNNELRREEIVNSMKNTACYFSHNRKVYMMRPIPEMEVNVPEEIERRIMRGSLKSRISIKIDDYYERHRRTLHAQDEIAKTCGVTLLDPVPYLCSEGRCWGDLEGVPLYYDDDHLSERGSALLIPLFQKIAAELPASR